LLTMIDKDISVSNIRKIIHHKPINVGEEILTFCSS